MRHHDTPEQVQARWAGCYRFDPFQRERFHAEMDAAERRTGRRARYSPRYTRLRDWRADIPHDDGRWSWGDR